VRADARSFLAGNRETYDLIFLDPPFAMDDDAVDRILGLAAGRLSQTGVVVIHRRAGGSPPKSDNLQGADPRRYGDSEIWILEKEQR
jgi:16S rRNA (guanine966-N2)-methyltransferase